MIDMRVFHEFLKNLSSGKQLEFSPKKFLAVSTTQIGGLKNTGSVWSLDFLGCSP